MNFLEERIISDGIIKPGNILKIDNFLNHQIDIGIIRQIANELKRRFGGVEVTKSLPSKPVVSLWQQCWAIYIMCPWFLPRRARLPTAPTTNTCRTPTHTPTKKRTKSLCQSLTCNQLTVY